MPTFVRREIRRFLASRIFFRNSRVEHATLGWIWSTMIALHFSLGLAVLLGGEQRFTYPTYQPLVDLSHGRTWMWGWWMIASAALMLYPSRLSQIVGTWLGMCWSIVWCTLFAVAVFEYPNAGATATVAYGGFAMINAALLTARVIDRKRC
jgi:hypothetical protein